MRITNLTLTLLFVAVPIVAITDDLEDALQNLKAAESKKDPALLKKVAIETYGVAHQEASTPAPEKEGDKEYWTKRVAYARNIEMQADYALYATAIQSPPAVAVDLLATLEKQNPKSSYLNEGYARYFLLLSQTGGAAKIPSIAEKAIGHFPDNTDLLLVLATDAMNRKQLDRELLYAERLVSADNKHQKPEGYSAADWEKKRNISLSRGYWMCGVAHSEKGQYYEADRDLRAALPLIQGNEAMQAAALFHLGLANYQVGKMTLNKQRVLEGAKFSQQAAAIKGPYADQAWRNAQQMKTEAVGMR